MIVFAVSVVESREGARNSRECRDAAGNGDGSSCPYLSIRSKCVSALDLGMASVGCTAIYGCRQGPVSRFASGVSVVPANGFAGGSPTNFFSSVKIDNLVVNGGGNPQGTGACVFFEQVNSSIISNCSFNANDYGIRDFLSTGGNRYFNVSFTRCGQLLFVDTIGGNGILEHCHFEAPAN